MADPREAFNSGISRYQSPKELQDLFERQIRHRLDFAQPPSYIAKERFLEVTNGGWLGQCIRRYYGFNEQARIFEPMAAAHFTDSFGTSSNDPRYHINKVEKFGERGDSISIVWSRSAPIAEREVLAWKHVRIVNGIVEIAPSFAVEIRLRPDPSLLNDDFELLYNEDQTLIAVKNDQLEHNSRFTRIAFAFSEQGLAYIKGLSPVYGNCVLTTAFEDELLRYPGRVSIIDDISCRLFYEVNEVDGGDGEEREKFCILRKEKKGKTIWYIKMPLRGADIASELFPSPFFDNPFETDPAHDTWVTADWQTMLGGLHWEQTLPKVSDEDAKLPPT